MIKILLKKSNKIKFLLFLFPFSLTYLGFGLSIFKLLASSYSILDPDYKF